MILQMRTHLKNLMNRGDASEPRMQEKTKREPGSSLKSVHVPHMWSRVSVTKNMIHISKRLWLIEKY